MELSRKKEEALKFMRDNYGNIKAKEIAKMFDLTVRQVYGIAGKNNLTEPLNKLIEINDVQHQVFLGSILGDGNFKRNGSNCYFRVSHSINEIDYLVWKRNMLRDFISSDHLQEDHRGKNVIYTIQTKNSPSLNKYKDMNNDDVILGLDELGILIWFLDDGWYSNHSRAGNMYVSFGTLGKHEQDMLINKIRDVLNIETHTIGIKRRDLCIPSKYNVTLKEKFYKYFDKDMDIIAKKVNELQ